MFAVTRLVEGLVAAHIFIGIAYLVGSNAVSWDRRDLTPDSAMVRFVTTCALGFSIVGFGTFAIACIGWLTPSGEAVTLATLFLGGCAIARTSPFCVQYWASRSRLIVRAFDVPHLFLYVALLAVAMPAVNLTNTGSDALAFHWAYAMDWIHAHRLVVDPFLREPFYAHNDLLLITAVLLFGGAVFALFPMWAFGLLTALGVCAGVRLGFNIKSPWPGLLGTLLALAVTYSPSYLNWLDSGYLDVALGFFALASVLAIQLAFNESADWRWLTVSAVITAFLIGSKTSLLPFSLVYAGVFAFAARRLACSGKQIGLVLVTLLVLAAPWYTRNFILAGDIVPPLLNIAVYGHDGLDTKFDVEAVAKDLSVSRTPTSLMTLPVRAFLTPSTHDFRVYGTNALVLFLYVPSIVVLLLIAISRTRVPTSVTLAVFLLTTMIVYWFGTSTQMRYGILFFPLLALCCGLTAASLPIRMQLLGPVSSLIAVCMLIITPNATARNAYHDYFVNEILNAPRYYTADKPALDKFVQGYVEEQFAAKVIKQIALPGRVYVSYGNYIHYYYRADGIDSIGDWVGPAGLFWLYHAVATRQTAQFLHGLDVDAVVIDPALVLGGLDVPLERQLVAAGYCRVPIPGSAMILLVDPPDGCVQMQRVLRKGGMFVSTARR